MRLSRRSFVRVTSLSAGATLVPTIAGAALAGQASRAGLGDWAAVRGLFELAPDRVHAALFFLASHPRPVREAVEELRRRIDANPVDVVEEGAFGLGEHNLMVRSMTAVARYIGAQPQEVVLTNSTTHGLGIVYQGLPLGPGDEVLTTAHDHIAHHDSVRLAVARSGATTRRVRLFEPHDASLARAEGLVRTLREAISPATRVLGVTWVHSSSGLKLPLEPLAAAVREVNERRKPSERVLLVVDGVHGLGACEPRIAEIGVDVFVAGLHKWMLAPRGTGFVWAREDIWARMRPVISSFLADDVYEAWVQGRAPEAPARATWFGMGGFQAYEHLWAIPSAVEMHEAIGPDRVAERIRALNGAAREALSRISHVQLRTPRDPGLTAGIIALEVDGLEPEAAVKKLREHRVIASSSPYSPSYLRLSFGLANSESDVDRAVAAVRALRA